MTVLVDPGGRGLWAFSRPPWERDANVTNVWVADQQFMHAAPSLPSIDVVNPAKGAIALAASSCSWQGGYLRPEGPGYISPGASGYLGADALAALVTGNDIGWSMVLACRIQAAQAPAARLWSFGRSSSASPLVDAAFLGISQQYQHFRRSDAGGGDIKGSGVHSPGTSGLVLTYLFDAPTRTLTTRENGVTIDNAVNFDVGSLTVDRFAFMGLVTSVSGVTLFSVYDWRAAAFGPGTFPASTYKRLEYYWMREARIPITP